MEELRRLITVYGDGKININTVSAQVLEVLLSGYARSLGREEDINAASAGALIVEYRRDAAHMFIYPAQLSAGVPVIFPRHEATADMQAVVNALAGIIACDSPLFRIEAYGFDRGSSVAGVHISAVFDRLRKQFVWWHQ
jgi:hypothetical protein